MALRCLLVSLVASLGFELPSQQDFKSWTLASEGWVTARAGEVATFGTDASRWLKGSESAQLLTAASTLNNEVALATTEPVPIDEDLSFESITEGMVLAFITEADQIRAEEEQPPAPDAEPALVAAVGSTMIDEAEMMALAFPAPGADSTVDEENDLSIAPRPHAGRLTSAVRLTQAAVQAWAVVVQNLTDEMITIR